MPEHQNTMVFEKVRPERFSKFLEFYAANPDIYRLFVNLTLEAYRSGVTRTGARLISERIRWQHVVQEKQGDFKWNDHLTPYYSRLVMARNELLRGFFETRDGKFDTTVEELVRACGEINGNWKYTEEEAE